MYMKLSGITSVDFNITDQLLTKHSVFIRYWRKVEVRGPFEKFVDWWQCAAVMQREAAIVMPSCRGGSKVVAA
jgi:hypothetical protein